MIPCDKIFKLNIERSLEIHKYFREHAGGMKCARKNFKHYLDVNALRGHTAVAQEDITMLFVP